jgi:pimeloyl-ACP methyl ester carboxylesterase
MATFDYGGDGPLLLLVHATGFCGATLEPLARALQDRFHCLAVDLRAHGDTGGDTPDDWTQYALELEETIRHAADPSEPVFGFGHSLGGAVVLLTEIASPGRFAGIYCYEPAIHPAGPDDVGMAAFLSRTEHRRRQFPSRQDAAAHFAGRPPYSGLSPDSLAAYLDHGLRDDPLGGVSLKCDPACEAAVYARSGENGDRILARLGEVTCPVVLGVGAETDERRQEWIADITARTPNARVVEVSALGHLGPLEDPRKVASSMRTAFGGQPQPAGTSGIRCLSA